ncbi:TPA: hypothetical protein ACPZUA_003874 [Yersinia enterocolitica]
MSLWTKINCLFRSKTLLVSERHTHESTLKNLRLIAKDTLELSDLVGKLDSKQITDEVFIAACVEQMSKELIIYREEEEKRDIQTW